MQRVSPRAIDLNIILRPDAARAVAEWAAWSAVVRVTNSGQGQVLQYNIAEANGGKAGGQGQVLQYNIAEANGGKEKGRESV